MEATSPEGKAEYLEEQPGLCPPGRAQRISRELDSTRTGLGPKISLGKECITVASELPIGLQWSLETGERPAGTLRKKKENTSSVGRRLSVEEAQGSQLWLGSSNQEIPL
jgi:hypothetical protein